MCDHPPSPLFSECLLCLSHGAFISLDPGVRSKQMKRLSCALNTGSKSLVGMSNHFPGELLEFFIVITPPLCAGLGGMESKTCAEIIKEIVTVLSSRAKRGGMVRDEEEKTKIDDSLFVLVSALCQGASQLILENHDGESIGESLDEQIGSCFDLVALAIKNCESSFVSAMQQRTFSGLIVKSCSNPHQKSQFDSAWNVVEAVCTQAKANPHCFREWNESSLLDAMLQVPEVLIIGLKSGLRSALKCLESLLICRDQDGGPVLKDVFWECLCMSSSSMGAEEPNMSLGDALCHAKLSGKSPRSDVDSPCGPCALAICVQHPPEFVFNSLASSSRFLLTLASEAATREDRSSLRALSMLAATSPLFSLERNHAVRLVTDFCDRFHVCDNDDDRFAVYSILSRTLREGCCTEQSIKDVVDVIRPYVALLEQGAIDLLVDAITATDDAELNGVCSIDLRNAVRVRNALPASEFVSLNFHSKVIAGISRVLTRLVNSRGNYSSAALGCLQVCIDTFEAITTSSFVSMHKDSAFPFHEWISSVSLLLSTASTMAPDLGTRFAMNLQRTGFIVCAMDVDMSGMLSANVDQVRQIIGTVCSLCAFPFFLPVEINFSFGSDWTLHMDRIGSTASLGTSCAMLFDVSNAVSKSHNTRCKLLKQLETWVAAKPLDVAELVFVVLLLSESRCETCFSGDGLNLSSRRNMIRTLNAQLSMACKYQVCTSLELILRVCHTRSQHVIKHVLGVVSEVYSSSPLFPFILPSLFSKEHSILTPNDAIDFVTTTLQMCGDLERDNHTARNLLKTYSAFVDPVEASMAQIFEDDLGQLVTQRWDLFDAVVCVINETDSIVKRLPPSRVSIILDWLMFHTSAPGLFSTEEDVLRRVACWSAIVVCARGLQKFNVSAEWGARFLDVFNSEFGYSFLGMSVRLELMNICETFSEFGEFEETNLSVMRRLRQSANLKNVRNTNLTEDQVEFLDVRWVSTLLNCGKIAHRDDATACLVDCLCRSSNANVRHTILNSFSTRLKNEFVKLETTQGDGNEIYWLKGPATLERVSMAATAQYTLATDAAHRAQALIFLAGICTATASTANDEAYVSPWLGRIATSRSRINLAALTLSILACGGSNRLPEKLVSAIDTVVRSEDWFDFQSAICAVASIALSLKRKTIGISTFVITVQERLHSFCSSFTTPVTLDSASAHDGDVDFSKFSKRASARIFLAAQQGWRLCPSFASDFAILVCREWTGSPVDERRGRAFAHDMAMAVLSSIPIMLKLPKIAPSSQWNVTNKNRRAIEHVVGTPTIRSKKRSKTCKQVAEGALINPVVAFFELGEPVFVEWECVYFPALVSMPPAEVVSKKIEHDFITDVVYGEEPQQISVFYLQDRSFEHYVNVNRVERNVSMS